MGKGRQSYNKIKLCVSGSSENSNCTQGSLEVAEALGREIARHNAILVTGACNGFPLWTAMGSKEEGGISLGFSPASNEKEHTLDYRLPLDYMDTVIYTGLGYSGRSLLLSKTADAVFVGCGRIGTINEFTVAYEDGKPVGVLEGGWMTDEIVKFIMNESHRTNKNIVFVSDPKRLVEKVIDMVQQNKSHNLMYNNSIKSSH